MNSGMTLTSILVAVALSGIIAVFGSRLVVNQMFMAATAGLIDKGDSIMNFYANTLRDREVWRCTLFDTDNTNLKNYVLGNRSTIPQISLRGPNCKPIRTISPSRVSGQEWRNHPELTGLGGLTRGDELIPPAGKFIGDSIAGSSVGSGDGWWKVTLDVGSGGGKGDADLILRLCLQEGIYTKKHEGYKQVPRGYRYKCSRPQSEHMTRRIRFSENAIKDDCSQKAIISVTDRTTTGIIDATCSAKKLLSFSASSTAIDEYKLAPDGLSRPNDRQAIKPVAINNRHPIIGTNSAGELTLGTDRVLLHSLGPGTNIGEHGGSECGFEYVNGNVQLDLVVCGINNDGTIRCCSRKGPKGPDGLKGCPASKRYAVKGCMTGNSASCPTLWPNPLPPNGVPTCSSEQ